MLHFLAKAFRGWMTFILIMILIGFTIGGAVAGYYLDNGTFEGKAIFGIFIGAFIGLMFIIIRGGYIANILSMVDNVEKQEIYLKLLLEKNNIKIPKINENITVGNFNTLLQELQKPIEKRNVKSNEPVFENNELNIKICNNCSQEVSINIDKCNKCGCNDFSQI